MSSSRGDGAAVSEPVRGPWASVQATDNCFSVAAISSADTRFSGCPTRLVTQARVQPRRGEARDRSGKAHTARRDTHFVGDACVRECSHLRRFTHPTRTGTPEWQTERQCIVIWLDALPAGGLHSIKAMPTSLDGKRQRVTLDPQLDLPPPPTQVIVGVQSTILTRQGHLTRAVHALACCGCSGRHLERDPDADSYLPLVRPGAGDLGIPPAY